MTTVAEKLAKLGRDNLQQLAEKLNLDIDDKAFEGLKEWRLVLSLLLEWEKKSESKKKSRQELARIFAALHDHTHGGQNRRKEYSKLARMLDFTGMFSLYM